MLECGLAWGEGNGLHLERCGRELDDVHGGLGRSGPRGKLVAGLAVKDWRRRKEA